MKASESEYHSYLLRLWRVKDNGYQWRATLEDVQTGKMHGFPHLAALMLFLGEVCSTTRCGEAVVEKKPEKYP